PDFAGERARIKGERSRRGRPWLDPQAEHVGAKIDEIQLHELRCALKDLDVGYRADLQRARGGDPRQRDENADHTTTDECDSRQGDGPAGRQQQIGELVEGEFADHACLLQGANSQRSISAKIAWKPKAITRYMPVATR